MWDKLLACQQNVSEALLKKYHLLATCMVLLSQGIPFLHSGQEFFRTKYSIGNSYRSPDSINQLDWDQKWKYKENIEYIKGIIEIRKANECFRMRSTEEILQHIRLIPTSRRIIGFFYNNPAGMYHEMMLFINPLLTSQKIQIPEGEWYVLADEKISSKKPTHKVCSQQKKIEPISIMILGKN
jgi:pullulanase